MMWLLMGRGSTLVVLGAIVVLCSAQRVSTFVDIACCRGKNLIRFITGEAET